MSTRTLARTMALAVSTSVGVVLMQAPVALATTAANPAQPATTPSARAAAQADAAAGTSPTGSSTNSGDTSSGVGSSGSTAGAPGRFGPGTTQERSGGFGGGSSRSAAPSFADLDRDGDGRLTPQEAAGARGLNFERADANRDGVLDAAEFRAAQSQARER